MTTELTQSNYPEQLIELLRKAEQGGWANLPKIAAWRFSASEGRSVTLSIVDNKLGDVYGPPTARDSLGGGIYIIWEDNKRTSTSIDRRTIPEFEERLQEWRASALTKNTARPFANPNRLIPKSPCLTSRSKCW